MSRGPGDLDLLGAIAAVRAGRTTARALLDDARARAATWEPHLGAVVAEIEREPVEGPLHGAVLGIKDLMAVAGVPLGLGAPELADPRPQERDATAVARLVAAGATLAWTLQTHPLAYGIITPQTRNPRSPDRVAGGSTGGVAAAIAAGFIHGGLGTDTGGSVRIPAACCGTVGLKTTRGLVPQTGVAALAWSLDTVGVLADTVDGAAALLEVVAGPDPEDPANEPAPPSIPRPAGPLRVGVPSHTVDARMDEDVRAVWRSALEALRSTGAKVLPVELPHLEGANLANGRILAAEAAAVWGEVFERHPDRFHPTIQPRLRAGLEQPAVTLARALRHRTELAAELRAAFAEVDVLCTPTLPCRVPAVGREDLVVGGEPEHVVPALTRFTNPWNLTGVPAGSVPAGRDSDGAPVGVQLVGPWWGEPRVLAAMKVLETELGGPWPTANPPT